MDKISVIVPIYNCANYLDNCLKSIVNQTYKNLEIILVNDGSTDESLKICYDFQSKDERIKIVNQPNKGTSAAKNKGIDIASGKYISFIDADDWLADTTALQTLFNMLKDTNSDVSVANFAKFDENTQSFKIHIFTDKHPVKILSPHDWFKNEYANKDDIGQCFYTPWGKLFKLSLFRNIRFPKSMVNEDDLTLWKLYLLANQISYSNNPLYVYGRL